LRRRFRNVTIAACLAAVAAAGGCGPTTLEVAPRPTAATDACAERMHDILGQILLYYAAHRMLPPTAEALSAAGGSVPPLVCPVSGKSYVYNPKGLLIADRPGIVVLYDCEPTHWGMRWGVLLEPPFGGRTLAARVILLEEKNFPAAR